jgi:hypothetical protein
MSGIAGYSSGVGNSGMTAAIETIRRFLKGVAALAASSLGKSASSLTLGYLIGNGGYCSRDVRIKADVCQSRRRRLLANAHDCLWHD